MIYRFKIKGKKYRLNTEDSILIQLLKYTIIFITFYITYIILYYASFGFSTMN